MKWIAGADGCKAGWVVVLREVGTGKMEVRVAARIADVLKWKESPKVLCVGLLDRAVPGGRDCNKVARALLGQPRGSSVFSPPARRTLKARNFTEALRLNRGTGRQAPGISLEGFGILSKIREVNEFISPSLQKRVLEVHPEVSFYELNRRVPVVEPKRKGAGRKRRIQLLEKAWRTRVSPMIESRPRGVARDDIIDAMAACWTAERVLKKKGLPLPLQPPRDSRGLRMEIVR